MQNRRIFNDDHKGVDDWLNEKNDDGYGIRVKATYYLQLTDATN